MKVLVSGGAGFIGSHLAKRLAQEGHKVTVVDDLSAGRRDNLEGVDCDLRVFSVLDCGKFDGLFAEFQPDLVFHLAASRLDESYDNPVNDLLVNAQGTLNALELAAEYGVKRFVYTSTGSVYGEPECKGNDESHKLAPKTFYGVSKAAADHYCKLFHEMRGLPTVRLRLYNVYGPGRLAGSVPQFIQNALAGKPLLIQGGKQTRSLTFVDDVVDALVAASAEDKAVGEAFNISGMVPASIESLASSVAAACGGTPLMVYGGYRPNEIMFLEPSTAKAKRVLGWQPKTCLAEGLLKTVDWLKEQKSVSK